jgi:uncharacterized protein YaaN involved in tellurite resistance
VNLPLSSTIPSTPVSDTVPAPLPLAAIDPHKVSELAQQLRAAPLSALYSFGRELGSDAARQTDALLEQVRSKDLDAMGGRLSEVVSAARGLTLGALSDKRSKLPLIGGMLDRLRLKGGAVMMQFQDVRTQIDALMAELGGMQADLAGRVEMLGQAHEAVLQEHALLGAHVEAGELVLGELRMQAARIPPAGDDPLQAQQAHDLRGALAALDKRVADMRLLQHAALQQLPMIRMVQANNRVLIEKFHNVKELTIPAWKRQFMLALALDEQKNAAQLAHAIDDATNEFMLENARLLKDNTIAAARANQRQVIDVQTLQQVHESLMATVQEVARIHREGTQQRHGAAAQLAALRRQMGERLLS